MALNATYKPMTPDFISLAPTPLPGSDIYLPLHLLGGCLIGVLNLAWPAWNAWCPPPHPIVYSSMSLPSCLYGTIILIGRGPTYQNYYLQWEIQTCSTSLSSRYSCKCVPLTKAQVTGESSQSELTCRYSQSCLLPSCFSHLMLWITNHPRIRWLKI